MKNSLYSLLIVFFVGVLLLSGPSVFATQIPELRLNTTTEGYDHIRYEAAFLIQEAFEELGIKVNVLPTEFTSLIETFYDRQDFDLCIQGWGGRIDRLDPHHFLSTLHSDQIDLGGVNPGHYINSRYDELFESQAVEFDVNKRREFVFEAQLLAMEEQPFTVLYFRDEVLAYNNKNFDGFVTVPGENIYNEWIPLDVVPLGDKTTLSIGTSQEPDTINPLASNSHWGWMFLRLFYDKLVQLSPEVEPIPWIAKEINPVDDLTIEVVMREGMTFHDGEPITVEDVQFTYHYYMENDFVYFRAFYSPLDNVEIIDNQTLHFHLNSPAANFITVTMSQIPILPKHIWVDIEEPDQLAPDQIPTVGSGPMKFDRYDRGEYKRLVKFEDYFMADEIDIDAIEWIIYADSEGVFTGLLTGEVDMPTWRLDPAQIDLAEVEDHLTLVSVEDHGYYHMTYNLQVPPLDDVAFRRAIAHAIPKDTIVNVLMDGRGEPGVSMVAPSNAFWFNPETPVFEYNLERAKELLEEAGYWLDDEGRLNFPTN